jgi:AcrR family transcriptional regulator
MPRARTRLEQKEETRALLLKVGRRIFTKHGYDGASIALICRAARVTHGALYHHFESKLDVFTAVLEELTLEVAGSVEASVSGATGWGQVEAACRAYLDACTDPAVMAILLRDAPRVLDPRTFDDIDHGANEPMVTRLLESWIDAGVLRPLPVALVGRMLGGAFAEAGSAIAAAGAGGEARAQAETILLAWLTTFRACD